MMNAMAMCDASGARTRRLMMQVTVNQPAVRLYHEWRHLAHSRTATLRPLGVRAPTSQTSTIRAPRVAATGSLSAGEAELSLEVPGLLIAWTAHPMDGLVQTGEVWFSQLAADCSEVRLILTWQAGAALRDRLGDSGDTAVQLQRELTRFKQLMEQ